MCCCERVTAIVPDASVLGVLGREIGTWLCGLLSRERGAGVVDGRFVKVKWMGKACHRLLRVLNIRSDMQSIQAL